LFSDGKESKGTVEKQQKCNKIFEINQKYKFLPNFTETCIFHSRRPITGNVMAMKS